MNKTVRMILDILMTILLIQLIGTQGHIITVHEVLGLVMLLAVCIHIFLNKKWIAATVKNLFRGKLNKKSGYLFGLSLGLCVTYTVAIVTGIMMSQAIFPWGAASPVLHRAHAASAYIGMLLTVLHVKANFGFIKSFFKRKKPALGEKAV